MSGWEGWRIQICKDSTGKQCAEDAGIFGLDGSPWAVNGDGKLKNVNKTFFDVVDGVIEHGPSANVGALQLGEGNRYMILRHDAEQKMVIAKKGAGGMTIAKAKQCYVVGLYNSDAVHPSSNTKQVCYIKDELEKAGY